jgi:hypothetical protein
MLEGYKAGRLTKLESWGAVWRGSYKAGKLVNGIQIITDGTQIKPYILKRI